MTDEWIEQTLEAAFSMLDAPAPVDQAYVMTLDPDIAISLLDELQFHRAISSGRM